MERFMYLFRGGLQSESPEEMQKHMQKWFAWIEELKKKGKYLSGEPLNPGGKTVSGPKKSVTDGPFTEGKEVIGGFFIVNAKSYDDAVEMAKDCPDFNYGGTVEVREVMKM